MKSVLPLMFVFALAACAGTSSAWVKEGASKEQLRADQAACRAQADSAIGRSESFTRDIRSSTRGGREDTSAIVSESRDRRTARSYEGILERCMLARGYVHPTS
ncbi:MAG: hypothetical protein O3B37_03135 [Proteobacteria bacterium]|nr:hypothetical protein [Pseudomonadota bacterium]